MEYHLYNQRKDVDVESSYRDSLHEAALRRAARKGLHLILFGNSVPSIAHVIKSIYISRDQVRSVQ